MHGDVSGLSARRLRQFPIHNRVSLVEGKEREGGEGGLHGLMGDGGVSFLSSSLASSWLVDAFACVIARPAPCTIQCRILFHQDQLHHSRQALPHDGPAPAPHEAVESIDRFWRTVRSVPDWF